MQHFQRKRECVFRASESFGEPIDHSLMNLRFLITAQNKADVLSRVVILFHRSAVEIESIRMPARGKENELRVTITARKGQAQVHRMQASLEKLVDVLNVETVCKGKRTGSRVKAYS